MYELGKIEALDALGLRKHAGVWEMITQNISPAAAKRAKQYALGGALGGAVTGGLVGAYGTDHKGTTNAHRAFAGTLSGVFGGLTGGALGATHGIMKGLGHPGLRIADKAKAMALTGAITGGMHGAMGSDRRSIPRNTLVNAAVGGLYGGAGGALLDSLPAISPDLYQHLQQAARARGQEW